MNKKSGEMMVKSRDFSKWWIAAIFVIIILATVSVLVLASVHFAGIPILSGGDFSAGLIAVGNFVLGVFAVGTFSMGVVSVGTFSVGIISVGIFSVGIFSIGIFSIGIFSIGFYALGIYAVKMFLECRQDEGSKDTP
jgi:hypothetical protein